MLTHKIIQGDVLQVLPTLQDGSCDCCVTSPPYYGLRDYGVEGQLGLEKTPEEYVEKLVRVFREVRRVLRDDGTLWLNLGDSYAGSGKGGGPGKQITNRGSGTVRGTHNGNCKPKDLLGIPWMVAFALRADGWYLRQDIIWHKPNPMPESVTDRCTKSHEYMFLLSKSPHYYFDKEAIAEPIAASSVQGYAQNIAEQAGSDRVPGKSNGPMKAVAPSFKGKGNSRTFRGGGVYTSGRSFDNSGSQERESHGNTPNETGLRNRRSVWTVATKGYTGAHFATFPPDLIRPCILAGSRLGGVVLDPFLGSGTTGEVALEEGRGFIGIELNPDYVELANERVERALPLAAQTRMY